MDLYKIHLLFIPISAEFPRNTIRKNYFLAACKFIFPEVDLELVDSACKYGGKIGINNSKLDLIFRHSKIFRLHAILHDAAGYMKSTAGYNKGPGYCYMLPNWKLTNSCYLGHVTGLLFCLYLKIFQCNLFNLLEC